MTCEVITIIDSVQSFILLFFFSTLHQINNILLILTYFPIWMATFSVA